MLQLPEKPELEVPTPPQPQKEPEFRIILPFFTFLAINTWFLATWTLPPALQYLRKLKVFAATWGPSLRLVFAS
jgi:hypothetical protein